MVNYPYFKCASELREVNYYVQSELQFKSVRLSYKNNI